ncbi:tripeptidyl peptidase [Moniliophthora roreri]|nr:tripeptidyl peptidase [Moniliophthora roreri]
MMWPSLLAHTAFALTAIASVSLAGPSKRLPPAIKESVHPPRGWVKDSLPPPNHIINLRIGLPQPNFAALEEHLYQVSDPFHERYGQHLSKEDVEELVAPHPESVDSVTEWLASHGIGEAEIGRSPAKDWIYLSVPVSVAEELLDTTYYVWKHSESGDYLVRTTSYSLPKDLHAHVDVIQPTTMFARFKNMRTTIHDIVDEPVEASNLKVAAQSAEKIKLPNGIEVDASCNSTITISCLQQLYNAVGYTPSADIGNSIGITGYLEEFANIQDLQSFYAEQRPDALGTSFEFISVKGGENSQNLSEAGAEANLDVQFAFGLSFPINGTFWSTAGRPPFKPDLTTPQNTNEPYNDWLDFVLASDNIPYVISTSYGEAEQTVPESYARRACATFAQLGARGVSLFFSSGDGGVGDGNEDPATQQCITNDGRNITKFMPGFPASCPYVTAVGGTIFVPEVAVDFSGGGFSDYWSRPAYQEKAVSAFLDKLPKGTYEGLFNRKGRAFPDVAAEGRFFRIWLSGVPRSIGGTSASSPAFAGIVALLNDARLKVGLPPLGFLNPFLYSKGISGLTDITSGNNPGCGTPGFNATEGWDPVTGLGTPNFFKLKDLVTKKHY